MGDAIREGVGFVAGCLTTAAFVPQVVHVWTTRSTRDISLMTFLIFCPGLALWLLYGIWLGSLPIVVTNAVTLALALTILGFKLRYG